MKHLKSFFSLTLPLIIMLITFSIYLVVSKVVDNYKSKIVNDYSIMIIANTPLIKLKSVADIDVKEIQVLDKEKIIDDVKDKLTVSSLKLLKTKLPYFYQLYLEEFPTTYQLEQIRKELITISNVKRVETFSSDHNKIYSLLILIQDIIIVLFFIVMILSLLLLMQQIKLWFYAHSERISIIQYHGGSILYSSKPIINTMIASTIFSIIFVCGFFYLVIENISILVRPELLSLIPSIIDMQFDIIKIIAVAFIIPIFTFIGLLVIHKSN